MSKIPDKRNAKRVCHHCGLPAKRSYTVRSGKCSVKHKCPHGIECSGGHPTKCTNNRSHSCPRCRVDAVTAAHVARARSTRDKPDTVEVLASDAMKASEYAERHAHSLDQAGHVDYPTLVSIREVGKRLEAAARTVLGPKIQPKQKLTVWINLYPIGYPGLYKTRAEADSNAAPNRSECVERTIEFEKGEGL